MSERDFAVHVYGTIQDPEIVPVTVQAEGFSVDQETGVLNFYVQGRTTASFHDWMWVQEIKEMTSPLALRGVGNEDSAG